jgi:carbonic anhydrase
MPTLQHLIENNRVWAAKVRRADPEFFERLSNQQAPEFLWIGCADSRVPANEIVGLRPGELFVHRNIANVVVHTDLNCLSVIQFAVDLLGVRDIIVCGHYGCSGVRNAMDGRRVGLADNWLRHIQDVEATHAERLSRIAGEEARANRLCELNVIEQVRNVCRTSVIRDAWGRGQIVAVHGWIYGLHDGFIRDLGVSVRDEAEATARPAAALAALDSRAED